MQSSIIKDEYTQMQISHISEICKRIKPLVVIRSITYNHEHYLRDAIESFVKQQTNFPFVAVIHDDASTDDTASILKEYAEKYPDIILPIYETENQHSKHDGTLDNIMFNAVNATEAKYIAYCEGDDYWTDPNKLQKQVDFLESHPDYSMCFHNATVHYENKSKSDHPFAYLESREYQIEENIDHWIVPTASIVYRKEVLHSKWFQAVKASTRFVVGDNPLIRSCGMTGKLYAFADTMSVYRKQPGGWTERLDTSMAYKLMLQETEYVRVFGKRFSSYSKAGIARHSRAALSLLNHGRHKEALKIWKYALLHAPIASIKANILFAIKLYSNRN